MSVPQQKYDIAIIGAGACGMTAAITAARRGASVCLIEGGARVGTKILKTGNGKCNLSHAPIEGDEYRGSDSKRVAGFLNRFGVDETLEFFKSIGLITREKDGYIYPYSEMASSVLDVLRFAVAASGAEVICSAKATAISGSDGDYAVLCKIDPDGNGNSKSAKSEIHAKKVILCTGGCADPVSGSDGSGIRIAENLGLNVLKPLPALVKVKAANSKDMAVCAGVRSKGVVSVYVGNGASDIASGANPVSYDRGEIQFTKDGLSGIPVFNVSRYISRALDEGDSVRIRLDLCPEMNEDELAFFITDHIRNGYGNAGISIDEALSGIQNKKLNTYILKTIGVKPSAPAADIGRDEISRYAHALKALDFNIENTYGFEQAQVTSGGVDLNEVDDNLQAVRYPGMYLAGELLDVDGPCGGYNLQWAWTSGYIAGNSAASDL
ncbi:MAG: aminoacetone oxidase family FAD-binding enzyme [Lachnospiraceae bacterium]|nr:aminoacetone oxidase family FAD-binding enzyme [Lachnospiraceae bacterium]